MGNQVTCCSLSNPCVLPINISKSTTVILPTGEVRLLHKPTKAAELMMEAPNFFIINAKFLKVGARFCCLNADDDLERASVYIMFPMQRRNSLVTADDLGALFLNANSIAKRVLCTGNIKVQPDSTSGGATQEAIARLSASVPRLSLDGVEELATPEFLLRRSMTRSKKPLLETIVEEPSHSKSHKSVNSQKQKFIRIQTFFIASQITMEGLQHKQQDPIRPADSRMDSMAWDKSRDPDGDPGTVDTLEAFLISTEAMHV